MAQLIRGLYNIKPFHQGGILTIGNFDGVHLGHQKLLNEVVDQAKQQHIPTVAITFEPHPEEFFQARKVIAIPSAPRLTRLREKFKAIAKCDIQHVLVLSFNHVIAFLSAQDFIQHVLHHYLLPKKIIIGDDFRFGFQRQGDFALLEKLGKTLGFAVQTMPTFTIQGERVSSTRVRHALAKGDLDLVIELLGRSYSLQGRIRQGDKLGRKLGFPTANIYLHRLLTPIQGVYTVYMYGIGDKPLPGVANIGTRPTVDGTRVVLEVHLLNFHQEIYGKYVEIAFCKKLRDEKRYATIDLLKEQIAEDVKQAITYFNLKF
jgi:riboflavin kinase / FMN adenylyltransferase